MLMIRQASLYLKHLYFIILTNGFELPQKRRSLMRSSCGNTHHKMKYLTILFLTSIVYSQDEDLDLDAMWENTVWEEIENVTDEAYEVEKVTAVAGVRGAEAEDEALHHLYYRRSMKGLSKLDLQKALGKLIIKREKISDDNPKAKKIDDYILQLRKKLKKL